MNTDQWVDATPTTHITDTSFTALYAVCVIDLLGDQLNANVVASSCLESCFFSIIKYCEDNT